MLKAVGVAASSVPASAQSPERTTVREDDEHCPTASWQVSQALTRNDEVDAETGE